MGTIEVKQKTVYGKNLFYPANDPAKLAAQMVNRATLTLEDLSYLKRLGFAIEVQAPAVPTF